MGRRISSLFLAVLLFVAACPASVLAKNGAPAGTQEIKEIQETSETRMTKTQDNAGGTGIPEEAALGTDPEGTVVFGGSVSENGMGSGETPGEGEPEEPELPGVGDSLPVWDESQELMLYGLADAAAYGAARRDRTTRHTGTA